MERAWITKVIQYGTIALVSFLIIYPVFWLFYGSFTAVEGNVFSLDAYIKLFGLTGIDEIVYNTLIYGLFTTFFAVFIGVVLAWITARTDTPFKGFIELVSILPFVTAPFIGAAVWAVVFFMCLLMKWGPEERSIGDITPLWDKVRQMRL